MRKRQKKKNLKRRLRDFLTESFDLVKSYPQHKVTVLEGLAELQEAMAKS
jgi:hypothetical protein